jgi:hypothetical protein
MMIVVVGFGPPVVAVAPAASASHSYWYVNSCYICWFCVKPKGFSLFFKGEQLGRSWEFSKTGKQDVPALLN